VPVFARGDVNNEASCHKLLKARTSRRVILQ
jgi:hypothetical protein